MPPVVRIRMVPVALSGMVSATDGAQRVMSAPLIPVSAAKQLAAEMVPGLIPKEFAKPTDAPGATDVPLMLWDTLSSPTFPPARAPRLAAVIAAVCVMAPPDESLTVPVPALTAALSAKVAALLHSVMSPLLVVTP